MLATHISALRTLDDLTALFAALGYEPAALHGRHGARVVAQWRGFRVFAVSADSPEAAARSLARALRTSGERAIAVALSPQCLVIAAPRPDPTHTTRVLTVPLRGATPFALQQLESLRPAPTSNALSHALRVTEALSTQVAGERFFTAFRITLERMAASLDQRRPVADRRMVALLSLTRVLFLYFVQAKGWLDGRPDYLRSLLDITLARRRHFHRTALHLLFFGTLNRPMPQRRHARRLGDIPYLNGGLFEPHPVERRVGPAHFANGLWRDAFDQLFDRFRFCLREAHEVDAIAPDMLGRVFERLMDEDERHDTGTYYTPESLVAEIVRATIRTALRGHALDRLIDRAVSGDRLSEANRREGQRGLRRLRILDPAAGSGAFLLGALEHLTELRLAVERRRTARTRWRLRRDILRRNLFGVDLNPTAVRLAELRLWLAVVADDPTSEIASVRPLPNLDGVVRQGDTLLDPLGAARALGVRRPPVMARMTPAVQEARDALFDARGGAHPQAIAALRESERQLAGALLKSGLDATVAALRELRIAAAGRDLFGRRSGLTAGQKSRYRMLARSHRDLRRAALALRDDQLPFFAFEVHAPDIVAAGGFDVVLGNPPWVRAERLAPDRRRALRQRFSYWRSEKQPGFRHLPDLSVAFLERAIELTAPHGAVGFLLPSKLASAGYASPIRRHLVRETSLAYVHRVPARQSARFGATTYPLAVVLKKTPPAPDHALRLAFGSTSTLRQRRLLDDGPWVLIPDRARDALEHFRHSGTPLSRVAPPALGVKTGADDVMVGVVVADTAEGTRVRFGGREAVVEPALLRSALRGRDLQPFATRPTRVLFWPYDVRGDLLRQLPPQARRYIHGSSRRLRARADYRHGPIWALFRTAAVHAPHRVAWPDIARRPRAAVLEETAAAGAMPLNTCYLATPPDRATALVVAAVLNSTWAAALLNLIADEARGDYRRLNARAAGHIPLPPPGAGRAQVAEVARAAHRGIRVPDDELDDVVAQALGLPASVCADLRSLAAHRR